MTMRRDEDRREEGFTLIEILVVVAIIGILTAILAAAIPAAQKMAGRADAAARLRTIGQAMFSSSADQHGLLPGPLWPGQTMIYDNNPRGRLVGELADYLDIERRDTPYLVDRMFPRAYRAAMRGQDMNEARVYVMNKAITLDGEVLAPFGSLSSGDIPLKSPLPLVSFTKVPDEERWMLAEADQRHPDVTAAPWKANTPAAPVHGAVRAVLRFDGSVAFEKP